MGNNNQLPPSVRYISFEYLAILVTAQVIICVIYHPPGKPGYFLVELDIQLSFILEHDGPMLVLGDMNLHSDNHYSLAVINALL